VSLIIPGQQPQPAAPVLDGPRLLFCYTCRTLTKVPAKPHHTTPNEHDHALNEIVERHQHHEVPEHNRKGGRLWATDQKTWDSMDVVTEVRKELMAHQVWIEEYRDTLMEDAAKCHRKHGQPEWPGKPCIDYKTDKKRIGGPLGRRSLDLNQLQYMCTYCPYESTVTTAKRFERGDYDK
jgi:hypothetical protein